MSHSLNYVGAIAGFRSAAAIIRDKNNEQSSLPSAKKIKTFGGFSSAKNVMKSCNANGAKDGAAAAMSAPSGNEINVDLLVRGRLFHKENISSLKSISLHREPMNMFDANAIAVKNDIGVVGHIAREQAVRTRKGSIFTSLFS